MAADKSFEYPFLTLTFSIPEQMPCHRANLVYTAYCVLACTLVAAQIV
jgi:hypothetical protein